MTPLDFHVAKQQFWMLHPFSEISGLRTAIRNSSLGGKEFSAHLIGLAVDGIYDTPLEDAEVTQLEVWSRALGLLWVLNLSTRLTFHVEPLNWRPVHNMMEAVEAP